MAEITRPERVLYFLLPGRLVCDENDHLTNSKLQSESLLISYFFYFNHGKGSVPCFLLLLKALKFWLIPVDVDLFTMRARQCFYVAIASPHYCFLKQSVLVSDLSRENICRDSGMLLSWPCKLQICWIFCFGKIKHARLFPLLPFVIITHCPCFFSSVHLYFFLLLLLKITYFAGEGAGRRNRLGLGGCS